MITMPTTLGRFFWHFLRERKLLLCCMVCTGMLFGLLTSLIPVALKDLIDGLVEGSDKAQIAGIMYVVLLGMQGFNFRLMDVLQIRLFPPLRSEIVARVFEYLNRHSYVFFQNNFAGSLANKVSDISQSCTRILLILDEYLGVTIAVVIAIVTMAMMVHVIFAVIVILWIISLLLISYACNKQTVKLSEVFSEARSSMIGQIVDAVGNFVNVISFSRHTFEDERIEASLDSIREKDSQLQKHILKIRIFQDIAFTLLIAGLVFSLITLHGKGLITAGDFALILTLTSSISQNIWWVLNRLSEFAEELGRARQALSIIAQEHDVVDRAGANALEVREGQIEFENVSLTYENNSKLFKNKSVTIRGREKVGLVGFSGAGKSSFANLILRFFDPQGGQIKIDGQDICEVTQESLRSNISYIPQDTALFHRSLYENIAYGNPLATKDEVYEAAKKAHAHDFIMELPNHYETLVGERGIKLSGGQRQRVAIARAFLKNAPILILDEATSALDSQTEALIQDSLRELIKDRTTIVIAHRLSTLSQMDRILVFQDGRIIQDGSHEQLLEEAGHYKDLWAMQSQGFLPSL